MNPKYLSSIHHDGSARYVRIRRNGALPIGDQVTIRLRTAMDAPIERLLLRTCPDGEQHFAEMKPASTQENPACRWWEVDLRVDMPVTGYRFLLFTSDGAWWYNGLGPQRHVPTDANDFRLLTNYDAPSWVWDSVFYQIFPDRFADGDPGSNVQSGEFEYRGLKSKAKRWGEPQSKWPEAMVEFYGGDLPGVEARLDYLTDLGVNAIYLNPIFSAFSNHRYDVTDYENVDSHLGGNIALESLRRALTERSMRCILDIVPNHCGVMHPWFQAALADSSAPSAEYFTFQRHPDEYESWLGVRSLPKMNYAGFTNPVLYWLGHFQVSQHSEPRQVESRLPWPTAALIETWQAHRASLPWIIARQQFNLLGSHDTPRIDHIVGGDAARKRLAIGLLFTYPGVPCVYYGDEIGMTARDSLEARNCMIWDSNEWDHDLRSFYKRLIQLRRTSQALIEGGFQILSSEENSLAFLRDTDAEQILVIGNRGRGERPVQELFVRHGGISDGTTFTEIFTGQTLTVQNGYLPLSVIPVGIQIWRSVSQS